MRHEPWLRSGAVRDYIAWVAARGGDWLAAAAPVHVTNEETFDVWFVGRDFYPCYANRAPWLNRSSRTIGSRSPESR
jgi:hypothetical protein